ncbi:manganese-binding transcriptional regulator MntR [Acidisoma sp. C75]
MPLRDITAHHPEETEATEETAFEKRHRLARAQRSSALTEDYVELIADLMELHGEVRVTEIARRLGVSHPTAVKSVARLRRDGLVTARPYRGIFLTEEGSLLAARVRARHQLVVRVLIEMGVAREDAEIDAEGIEHHVSDRTLEAFERYLTRRERPV